MPERKVALLLRIQKGLKDKLAELAKREHRSVNQQIEFLLEQALSNALNRAQDDRKDAKGGRGKP